MRSRRRRCPSLKIAPAATSRRRGTRTRPRSIREKEGSCWLHPIAEPDKANHGRKGSHPKRDHPEQEHVVLTYMSRLSRTHAVEGEDRRKNEEVLRGRQRNDPRTRFVIVKETSLGSGRVVDAVLQPQERACRFERLAVFERGRERFDELIGERPPAVGIPGDLRSNC